MPRTARKVDELAAEGEEMVDALAAVMEVADQKGTVTWSDVSDEISSGQWGRLIEKGLLMDADGDGFVIDDPEGVREALEEADPDPDEDDASWSKYDKIAAVGVFGLMAAYLIESVRAGIGQALDLLIGPIDAVVPFYVTIMVLAMFTGLYSTILQDNLMDMSMMSGYQEKTKELRERRERAKERDDQEELQRIQEEQMEMVAENMGMFKAQFRPMVWIMLLTIPVFLWLWWMIRDIGVAPPGDATAVIVLPYVGAVESWTAGIVGPFQVWIFWYFLCSMSFTQIMRKALNVQTSPT